MMSENDCSISQVSLVDALISAEVLFPKGGKSDSYEGINLVEAKVIQHFHNEDGNVVGNENI